MHRPATVAAAARDMAAATAPASRSADSPHPPPAPQLQEKNQSIRGGGRTARRGSGGARRVSQPRQQPGADVSHPTLALFTPSSPRFTLCHVSCHRCRPSRLPLPTYGEHAWRSVGQRHAPPGDTSTPTPAQPPVVPSPPDRGMAPSSRCGWGTPPDTPAGPWGGPQGPAAAAAAAARLAAATTDADADAAAASGVADGPPLPP